MTALTLSFLVLELEEPWRVELEKHGARAELAELTQKLYHIATARSLGVLYVQLNHARMLISSSVYESQCYGMWWILHLLYGQKHGFYTRGYREMAVRDKVIPVIFSLIKVPPHKSGFFVQMALEALSLLSEDAKVRIDLVKYNFFQIINQCATVSPLSSPMLPRKAVETAAVTASPAVAPGLNADAEDQMEVEHLELPDEAATAAVLDEEAAADFGVVYTAGMAAVKNVFSDPAAFYHEAPNTLKRLCENYIFENSDQGDWLPLAEIGHAHEFWRLKAVFVAKIFCDRMAAHAIDELADAELKLELQTAATVKRQFAKYCYAQLEAALGGENHSKIDVKALNTCLRYLVQTDDYSSAADLLQKMRLANVPGNEETNMIAALLQHQRN